VRDERQPRGAVGAGVAWPIVFRKHAANDIFVDLDAEGMSDLLGDPRVPETRIPPLHLHDGRDEFRGRTFGTGFAAMRRRGKEQAVFPIHQGPVEVEERRRLDERAKLRNPARAHEQRGQSEYEAIERGQIRRALPGSIADQKLMFEQKRLCGYGAYAAKPKQLRDGDQEMDNEDEKFAHRADGTITTSTRKTAPGRRIASHYEFASHRVGTLVSSV